MLALCKHYQKCHQDHKRKGPGQREQSPLLGAQLLRETKETLTASAVPESCRDQLPCGGTSLCQAAELLQARRQEEVQKHLGCCGRTGAGPGLMGFSLYMRALC